MRLSQVLSGAGQRHVCVTGADDICRRVAGFDGIRPLAQAAIDQGVPLCDVVADALTDEVIDLRAALDEGRILVPIDHPDPAHVMVSGSGLSHSAWLDREPDRGSDQDTWPDHYKTLMLGKRGGRPPKGRFGSQPEWFYKGTGEILIAPGGAVEHPHYGDGPGEEAEVAGIYIIGPEREAFCVGYCLGNEFSDEQMYFKNVYHLAQSKKRQVSLGPEVLVGDLPRDIPAKVSLTRGGHVQWQAEFRTGEQNMLHTIANIEAHYFKYNQWYIPGDVHVLYFGNAVMSTAEGEVVEDGDVYTIDCPTFGLPLTNTVVFGAVRAVPQVRALW